jgi:hypothetical protein
MRSTSGAVFHLSRSLAPPLPWDDLEDEDAVDIPFDDETLGAAIEFWVRGVVWCEPALALQVAKLGQFVGCDRMPDAVARLLVELVCDGGAAEFARGVDPAGLTNAVRRGSSTECPPLGAHAAAA